MSRDSQQVPATARAQRLEDRNMNKDRSQSLDVDEAEDKKYFGTITITLRSLWPFSWQ